MASKQALLPPNKTYEKALIWYETQTKYTIDATLKGQVVEMKLYKGGVLQKQTNEPFNMDFANVFQQKIINLYEYENLQNATRGT